MKALTPPGPRKPGRVASKVGSGWPDARTPPQGVASFDEMKSPSGVDVWQPMHDTGLRLYPGSSVSQVVAGGLMSHDVVPQVSTWATPSSLTANPFSVG